jgi:ribosome biogenesis GTPase
MTLPSKLPGLGLDFFFQQQLPFDGPESLVPVRVMNVHRSGLQLAGDGIDQHVQLTGHDYDLNLTVGDWALFDTDTQRLLHRLERKSLFKRRAPGGDRREQLIAANIDTLFIVSSCNMDFNEARLERYLALAREAQVMGVIILTKADLIDDTGDYVRRASRLAPGIQVEAVNALQGESLGCLDTWLQSGQTIALLGSSGVGKSTLTNTLLGAEEISTQAVREDDARGRHTTTSRSMHRLPGGAWLLDTPGMRELQLIDVKDGLESVFEEISVLAEECRFSDCSHKSEPGCKIQKAIEAGTIDQYRFDRWQKLVREEALNSATIAERRARDKALGRMYKHILRDKKAKKDA